MLTLCAAITLVAVLAAWPSWRVPGRATGTRLGLVVACAAALGTSACQAPLTSRPPTSPPISTGGLSVGAPTLVTDIGPATQRSIGAPEALTVVGGQAYFTVGKPGESRALWRSDGTGAGTTLIAELLKPGERAVAPSQIVPADDAIAIIVPTRDRLTIYRSDGSPEGTVRVASVPHEPFGAFSAELQPGARGFFFSTAPSPSKNIVWHSDGSEAGTRQLHTFTEMGGVAHLTAFGGVLYFAGGDSAGSNRAELWRSDGTPDGTVRVLERNITGLARAGPRLFVFASNFPEGEQDELWVIGADEQIAKIADVPGGWSAASGDRLFFASHPHMGEPSLYVSDGTPDGTRLIVDRLNPYDDGYVSEMAASGDQLFYVLRRYEQGHELWVSDGSAAGTHLVRSFTPAVADNLPHGLTAFGDQVLFAADDGTTGMELWMSDGTAAGTVPLSAIGVGPADGVPSHPMASYAYIDREPAVYFQAVTVGNRILFPGADGDKNFTLWSSDGTAAGTTPVGAAGKGVVSGDPQLLRVVGDRLLFFADDGVAGQELWASGGTAESTALLRDLNPGPEGSLPDVLTMQAFRQTPVVLGDALYLFADSPAGSGRWRSDGTADGTSELDSGLALLQAVAAAGDGTTAFGVVSAGGAAYFYQQDEGLQLWRSDGTEAGTARVGDLVITSSPLDFGPPPPPVVLNGRLYFASRDEHYDTELWVSDGTAAGTMRLRDLNPGSESSGPSALTVVGGTLFFLADDGAHGYELWASDGTAEGTKMLRDIKPGDEPIFPESDTTMPAAGPCPLGQFTAAPMAAIGNLLYFLADDGTTGCELWSSDGTEAGTRLVRDIRPGQESGMLACQQGRASAAAPELIPIEGGFLFVADDGASGCELWASDGTEVGTRQVVDLYPGPESGVVGELAAIGGAVLMAATDGATGVELWASDGTLAGTQLVGDIRPGPGSSAPAQLTVANGKVYLTADDGIHGRELWVSLYQSNQAKSAPQP